MARNDGRIEKGQSLSSAISARAWNRAQEAADRVLVAQPGTEGAGLTSATPAPNVVLVRNDSGQNVPWLGVLSFGGIVNDPGNGTLEGDNQQDSIARSFAVSPVLVGILPAATSFFMVAMEPIAAGKIGRAAVSGVFACKINVTDEGHGFAMPGNGDVTQLRSTTCSVMQIVWKQSGIGPNKWAVGVM